MGLYGWLWANEKEDEGRRRRRREWKKKEEVEEEEEEWDVVSGAGRGSRERRRRVEAMEAGLGSGRIGEDGMDWEDRSQNVPLPRGDSSSILSMKTRESQGRRGKSGTSKVTHHEDSIEARRNRELPSSAREKKARRWSGWRHLSRLSRTLNHYVQRQFPEWSPVIYRIWITALTLLTVQVLFRGRPVFLGSETVERLFPLEPSMHMKLEIFTAPKPFIGIDRENQIRALESWMALRPRPRITFLGHEEGYEEISKSYGVILDRRVDRNLLGVPLFNSVLDRVNASASRKRGTVVIFLNSDILLFYDFVFTVRKIMHDYKDWFAVAARWDLDSIPPPNEFEDSASYRNRIENLARTEGTLHTYGGIDLWAWSSPGPPLTDATMPHFVYGRGKYDNWLTHEAITSDKRAVIDISEACTLVHLKHDYHLVREGMQIPTGQAALADSGTGLKKSFWNERKDQKIELFINILLAQSSGSYRNQMGTILHAPFKIGSCYESAGICNFYRRRPHACRCEYSPFVHKAQNDPYAVHHSRTIFCGLQSASSDEGSPATESATHNQSSSTLFLDGNIKLSGREEFYEKGNGDARSDRKVLSFGFEDGAAVRELHSLLSEDRSDGNLITFGFPFTAEGILERTIRSQTVIATSATFAERNLLLNFVCMLRRIHMESFIVEATDDAMYQFAALRGIPVYLETLETSMTGKIQVAQQQEMAPFRVVRRLTGFNRTIIFCSLRTLWIGKPSDIPHLLVREYFDVGVFRHTGDVISLPNQGFVVDVLIGRGNGAIPLMDRFLASFSSDPGLSLSARILSVSCGRTGEHFVSGSLCSAPGGYQTVFFENDGILEETQRNPANLWTASTNPFDTISRSSRALIINHAEFLGLPASSQILELQRKSCLKVRAVADLCIYE